MRNASAPNGYEQRFISHPVDGVGGACENRGVWEQAWRTASREVDEEFGRNRRLHGDRIQCRAGCADCCSQLFQITEIEAGIISRGVRALDPAAREQLRSRAERYMTERRALVEGIGEPEAWGQLPPPGARLPCPALEDGVCSIYEHRPLICRKFGIPLWNPDRPGRVYACALNFADGDEINDGELIRIQTGIHERWKAVQRQYNEQGGRRESEPVTVARAILEDFTGAV
jgi:Fe-S-cluster containining protein